MANQSVANYATTGPTDHFSAVWKLSRAMKKAGWVYKGSADGTTKDATGVAGADKWGGNADPLADPLPGFATGAWWCAQGPSILKMPITAAVAGTFIRGENVVQATTGAEGELLGAVFDSGSSTGWVVIAPRVAGSGSGPLGWDFTKVVTGAVSGASFTASAQVVEYVTQVVFWRSAVGNTGSWFFQCVDPVGESASLFSTLIATAGCTPAIAPGGGGTGNGFPAVGSWVPCGTGGSVAHQFWTGLNAVNIGKCQIMAANCIAGAGVTADGSFILAYGDPTLNAGSFSGFSLQRLDDQEEGELCPYATWHPSATTVTAAVANASGNNALAEAPTWILGTSWSRSGAGAINAANVWIRGWRRRGLGTGDAFVALEPAGLAVFGSSGNGFPLVNIVTTDAERVASEAVPSFIAEPIWVVCLQSLTKVRKGTLRWLLMVPTGNGTDTYAGKTFVQLANFVTNSYALIGGPYDGVSTPVNA